MDAFILNKITNYVPQHFDINLFPEIAEKYVNRICKRFENDNLLKSEYMKFIKEYEDLGHMILLSENEIDLNKRVFIPHHPVFKMVN